MNTNKTIGFDLDGVIVDHTDLKIKLAKGKGFELTPKETHSNIIRKILPSDILKDIQNEIYCKNNDQPLLVGAFETIKKIKENNIRYFLISRRRTGDAKERALEVMKNRGLWPEYFNEKNVYFVETPEKKNETAKKLGVTHYIDDEIDVLEIMKNVPNRFLFDSFDNFKNNSEFKRLVNWKEVSAIIL